MTDAIKPRTVEVPIFQGDDWAQIKRLRKAVEVATAQTELRRLGDAENDASRAAAEHDAFVAEAETRATKVTLAALGRKQWRDLVLRHPAREDEAADQEFGFNSETLGDELVPLSLTKPDSSPQFETTTQADAWTEKLSHADFQRLYNAAYILNTDTTDPKADLSSRLARIGEEISRSPSRLGEASPSSTTSEPSENSG